MGLIAAEKRGSTLVVTINNPPLNLLTINLLKELTSTFLSFFNDSSVRSIILAGNKHFSAGADINLLKKLTANSANEFSKVGNKAVRAIASINVPTIAAIDGYCIGGGLELALACDLRVANKKAQFSQPEVNLGVIPGFGATQKLPRLIGKAKAKEMLFTTDLYTADEVLSFGLLNNVTRDNALKEALLLAEKMNHKSRNALMLAKEMVNNAGTLPEERGIAQERSKFASCFSTKDQKEGVRAFLEKREPKFEK